MSKKTSASRKGIQFGNSQHTLAATIPLDEVKIRSYQNSDQQDCREIFTRGMAHWISLAVRVDFPRYCFYMAVMGVFALFAADFTWSACIFGLYIGICIITMVVLYANAYNEGRKYTNTSLETDLKDIEKTYMSNDGSHMWVAEWNGKVVGMVGLLHNESHKPGSQK
ncbi:N-acetylaspartate synthetase [Desmophyllum pertusum]|uniref:N-acetylaspartate synthetase n=1 Tax=Desmophyllum pertusum TaxID=174260 RepID=A0A9W9YZ00_9CNID|nr:N-acetylaspartate synthetase [Desmophyllum pertusum]